MSLQDPKIVISESGGTLMSRPLKIGRNSPCPCGSGKKYKSCCLGKTDWQQLFSGPAEGAPRHFTLRGKNLGFISAIAAALQLDRFTQQPSFPEIKRAFSPRAVQEIFLSIQQLWPDLDDFERCIRAEAGTVTALYTGHYEPEAIFAAVTRLALYCDKIYLVDPFMRAEGIRDKYSPLLHPEEHRATAIKFTFLWMSLVPWIETGIVSFVRPLHDFIPRLYHRIIELERARFHTNPQLQATLDADVSRMINKQGPLDRGMGELFLLSTPDSVLREWYRKHAGEKPNDLSEDDLINHVHQRRDEHPYYVERLPGQNSEFHQTSSGASYELAKRMCSITNSHIVTNLPSRWKEVELDRESAGIDLQGWSPFAKALQESDLKMLNNVPMQAALQLRREERLESLRLFFRKVWKSCRDPDEFSETNAVNLSAELRDEVAKANEEWRKIDHDLLKWLGTTWGIAIVSSGSTGFVPAAAAATVTGITGLIQASMKRHTFKERFPAGFFLGLAH
jgi:hypothetical protein